MKEQFPQSEPQDGVHVHLNEGQREIVILHGKEPDKLDELAPEKLDIRGVIDSALEFLKIRVNDIDQHKAHILVNRDNLSITLIIDESDPYTQGVVRGELRFSKIFQQFGINTNKQWIPEQLGQFLKLNRSYFVSRDENMAVVNALKSFDAKVQQTVQKETKENGNRASVFRQAVDSNVPESFKLRLPIINGCPPYEIDVETYATVDGQQVSISLQSAGANDVVENIRTEYIDNIVANIRSVAPEIVIIEQ